jgi:AraC family transcriptional regulator
LKDLGFSLQQIGRILQNKLTLNELRGMLRLKHAELEQHIAEEQARLARIEVRLTQIEQEDDFLLSLVLQRKEQLIMEPEIVKKPAFSVVGLMYFGKNENNEIPQVWQDYLPRTGEIEGKLGCAYGLCGDVAEGGRFQYMAGHEVENLDAIPEGMERWDVPAQQYAVFPCTLQTIHETYEYIFKTWFIQSEYERGDGPDFEFYSEEFDAATGKENLYIYMPVKKR